MGQRGRRNCVPSAENPEPYNVASFEPGEQKNIASHVSHTAMNSVVIISAFPAHSTSFPESSSNVTSVVNSELAFILDLVNFISPRYDLCHLPGVKCQVTSALQLTKHTVEIVSPFSTDCLQIESVYYCKNNDTL